MKNRETEPSQASNPRQLPTDFSLFAGGPFFELLRRAKLCDDGLERVGRRVIVLSLLAWLPLLVLSAMEGHVWTGSAAVPFLVDLEAHIRLLVAMPLLLVAEAVAHRRMTTIGQSFLERNLIPESVMTRYEDSIASVFRLRNSALAEMLLISCVYGFGILIIWRQFVALETTTWYVTPSVNGSNLTFAGMWYGYVSLPLFQFLLLRWYYRLFIWARFLWQVSCFDLKLVPTHPDRLGGLGFLAHKTKAFIALAVAHGALVAGNLASRIFFAGATLKSFAPEIAVMVVFVMLAILGPLLTFVLQLAATKRMGLHEYGGLAERYVREFDTKWLRGGVRADDRGLLGSGDIQSLADLANGYEVVRTMRLAPISKETILMFTIATLVPISPLLLSMISLEEILKKLIGILL
jgi:hypothetical protein